MEDKKKTYVLLRIHKGGLWDVILKGKPPNGKVAHFKSEASARKIQKKFKTFGVYALSRVRP